MHTAQTRWNSLPLVTRTTYERHMPVVFRNWLDHKTYLIRQMADDPLDSHISGLTRDLANQVGGHLNFTRIPDGRTFADFC